VGLFLKYYLKAGITKKDTPLDFKESKKNNINIIVFILQR
jgi:hypothetical protein